MKNLTELNVSWNEITDISFIKKLKKITSLNLYQTGISNIFVLKNLINLTSLNLSYDVFADNDYVKNTKKNKTSLWRTIDISVLKNLTNLTELNLSYNEITDSSFLTNLKNLTKLTINIDISDISILKNLKNLTELTINSNNISNISVLKNLTNLTKLHLKGEQILDILVLKNLTNLTELGLANNNISDISFLKNLKNIRKLDLSDNKIADISVLKNLINIRELNLENNKISDISAIKYIEKLINLYLNNNQISDIQNLSELIYLEYLDLTKNKILKLPQKILNLDINIEYSYGSNSFQAINLFENPLEEPPIEIVKRGNNAIKSWFNAVSPKTTNERPKEQGNKLLIDSPSVTKSLEKLARPLNEVKVLLVGDGGAGKTSLVKRILKNEFDENSHQTQGININTWEIKDSKSNKIKLHFWDFGGQEIMHATHSFFLSKRSLYILVLDSRTGAKSVEYWLKHIESFGGNSPVIVVINKTDENSAFGIQQNKLQKIFNIKSFHKISCRTNKGIQELKQTINKQINEIELVQTLIPASWFAVKERIEQLKIKGKEYISPDYFTEICENEGIIKQETQNIILQFMHDIGIMLYFNTRDLNETSVINPQWITEAVYKIITSEKISNANGVFTISDLETILPANKYPKRKYFYITGLMNKFEICYYAGKSFIIPNLLPIEKPIFNFDYHNSLKYRIKYDFMPSQIMPRITVKLHNYLNSGLQWRNGVVLKNEKFKTTAIIEIYGVENVINIFVYGKQQRDFLTVILNTINEINLSYTNLETEEFVACNCNECKQNDNPHFYSYDFLIKYLKHGKRIIECPKNIDEVIIAKLLGSIIRIDKISVSSEFNEKLITEVSEHL